MYVSDLKPNPKSQSQPSLDFSDDENHHHDMIIELNPNPTLVSNSTPSSGGGGGGPNRMGPKKRAETWVQEETRSLISLRREMDSLFNTSKSNKHLWDQISSRMRDRGFDRSPAMCTDKWRNLLKEFKRVKYHNNGGNGCNGSAKMSYYKEIDEILRDRIRVGNGGSGSGGVGGYRSPSHSGGDLNHNGKVDSFLHFTDKGIDDDSIAFGPIEDNGRGTLNLERHSDHEGHPLAITTADAVTGGGVPPPFWRDTPTDGDDNHSYDGRVIAIKWGDYTRRVGVDGTADAIKDAIRSAFGIRTKRAFCLEDKDQIIRSLDRDMPLGTYTLHLDAGVTIKFCYEESDHISFPNQTISHTEEHTFYTEADFRDFMHHRGWSFLRELNGYRNINNMDDLRPDALYRGVS